MCTNEKAKQTFLKHLSVPVRHTVKSLKYSSHNPGFICWKHMHIRISYKPVV